MKARRVVVKLPGRVFLFFMNATDILWSGIIG